MKIKQGDSVLIMAGRDRGRKGKVLKVFPREARIIVEGVNIRKKHVKGRRAGEKGQVVAREAPLHISNCKLICAKCGVPARVGFHREGKKAHRVCKKCGGEA